MDYFFRGGLKHVRDKAARRWSYQHQAANAEDKVIKDNVDHSLESLNCVQSVNAVAEVESSESFSAESTYAV